MTRRSDKAMVSQKRAKLEQSPAAPQIPDLELVRAIGSGAFGEVWLARSVTGSYRAVKLVYRKQFRDSAPFEREFHGILKYEPISRSHDGLTDILHVGKNDAAGYFYYVMETADDVAGSKINPDSYEPRSLAGEIVRRGRLPVDECLRIGLALTAALEHLHKAGLVHRDIKPSNIIFVGGVAKLADIGLVADIGQSSLVGTPGYIAPDGPGKPQADLYSLGKVLYAISTGKNPDDFPDLPTDLVVPPEGEKLLKLNEVILKACEASVQRRYQTATEMHNDLTRLQQGQSVQIETPVESVPNNLPAQLTSFVGRESQIAEIKRLMGTNRLVTMTGAGGSGKTRLGLRVGAELLEGFPDGVWLVELAAISDPASVVQAAGKTLGVREQRNASLLETLTDELRSRRILLLLDNCEHLIDACANLAETLLKGCPRLRVLATSREPLGVAGETVWHVPPLATPEPTPLPPLEQLAEFEAVRLFSDRAVAVHASFALCDANAAAVAQICWRLDGIPLAIELAAARVRAMTPEQIAQRLSDRFRLLTGGSRTALARHQTLHATIEWSYNLLSEPERLLFSRLSVFAGGWVLEAAERVCVGDGIESGEVLDLLMHLVDKSLVIGETQGTVERYRMLETVRQYAHDRLARSDSLAAMRDAHLQFFLSVAVEAEAKLAGAEQKAWLKRMDAELDNLRAALAWALETEPAHALKLGWALGDFWSARGYYSEGQQWLERALSQAGQAPPQLRANALYLAGRMAWFQGDFPKALALADECSQLSRQLGHEQGVADASRLRGIIAREFGDYDQAVALYEQALPLYRKIGDRWGVASTLNNLAEILHVRGQFGQARVLYEQCLAISNELHDRRVAITVLNNMGELAIEEGDPTRARSHYVESLTISQELGDRRGIVNNLLGLAKLVCSENQLERAAVLFGASEALREKIHLSLSLDERARHDQHVATARAALGEAAFAAAWAAGRAMPLEQAITYALEVPADTG